MNISEKVSYIKGLAEGMKIDDSTNEGKILNEIIGVLKDIALEIEDINETIEEMVEFAADVEESLYELEDEVYGDVDFGGYDFDGGEMYEITCRGCGNTVSVDMSMLEDGSVKCPNCNETIEFDIDIIDADECDCGNDR